MYEVLEVRVDNIPTAYVLGRNGIPCTGEQAMRHCRDHYYQLKHRADALNADEQRRVTYHPV